MADLLRIGLLVERRYLAQSQPSGMSRALEAAGHSVRLLDPQAGTFTMGDDRWLEGLNLIVGRGRRYALLCLLSWAESRGILTINRKASIAAVYNKAEMAVTLARGDVATPRTFFGSVESLAEQVPEESFPLILKPVFGDNSQGLLVVGNAEELAAVEWSEPVALAQSYLPSDGYDLKLYGIGSDVWAVRKPSPFNKRSDSAATESKAELLALTPDLEKLGQRCGEIFNLDLYGVDCIETDRGPLVIEINDFPNYTGVPGADERLADYVIRRGRQEQHL